MAPSFRQKISSVVSLFALLVNLLPPASLVQAHNETLTPAEHAHPSPVPILIASPNSLTPVTTRVDAVLPRWFNPPATPSIDLSQTAGLSLARPVALANLSPRPLPLPVEARGQQPAASNQPLAVVLPGWFTIPRIDPEERLDFATMPAPARSPSVIPIWSDESAAVLPGWFNPALIGSQEGLNTNPFPAAVSGWSTTILPGWFQNSDTALPSDLPMTWPVSPAAAGGPEGRLDSAKGPLVAQSSAAVLPGWFNAAPPEALPSPVGSQRSAVTLPPLRPALAPIPQVTVNVTAPPSVSAGNFLGDTYTITIRNGSGSTTAFNFYITATIPASGFTYVNGSQNLISSINGPIAATASYTHPLVIWTPVSTYHLAPGEVVTLTFQMITNGSALSGQRLDGNAVYENPLGSAGGNNGGTNITVGRGNLVISKSPTVQDGTFGDVVSWTLEVANTGLGTVYSTTVSDTFGIGFINTDASQLNVPPFHLAIGERRSFVVTATINSCNNLTDTAKTWWSIGNSQGDASIANPASDTADIAYLLSAPNISLSSNSIAFDYCAQNPQTIVVTITNAVDAGPALNFRLTSAQLGSLPWSVGSISPGWSYNGAGVFTTSAPIRGGQVQTMSFVVTPSATVCGNEPAGTVSFASRYSDACNLFYNGPSTTVNYTYNGNNNTPGLALSKSAAVNGSTINYMVNMTAQNIQNISGTIVITDLVPAGLIINSFSTGGLGTITQTGNTLLWVITPGAGPGNLTGTLQITTTRSGDPDNCNSYNNMVTGSANTTCPACTGPLTASASATGLADPLQPLIALSVTEVITFDHCLTAPQTVVVTVTNTGAGPARNFALNFWQPGAVVPADLPNVQPYPDSLAGSYSEINVTAGSPNGGWNFMTSSQRFSYTANSGVISPGQTITFSFLITPDSVCGNGAEWTGELEAQYTNVCSTSFVGPLVEIEGTYTETNLPRFGLDKSSTANTPANVSDIFDYTIDFTARNAQNMSGTILITDIVPAAFTILAYTGTITAAPGGLYALTGTGAVPAGLVTSTIISSAVTSDTQLVWETPISNPSNTPYTLTGQLVIQVQVQDLSLECGAHLQYTNRATGEVGDSCSACDPLSGAASTDVTIAAPTGLPAAAAPKVAVSDGQVCGLVQVTNVYSRVFVSDWDRVAFTETLGTDFGLPVGALSYVTGTLSVIISNTDVTSQVVFSQTSPLLGLDFDAIASVIPAGTRDITITYRLFVSDTVLGGNSIITTNTRSQLEVQNVGSTGPCGSGDNTFFDTVTPLTLQRADLQVDISLSGAAACSIVPVLLTISDANLISNSLVANNIVVTFNVGSPDYGSISGYIYGGGFAGNPVTVTTGTNTITWTFQNPLTATGQTTGTIGFTMTRSCSAPPMSAGVSFSDRCGVTYGDTDVDTTSSPPPDVSLFVTPDQYTVNENKATWRIYATNSGAGTAGRTLITNAISTGLEFITYTTNLSGQVNLLTPGPFNPGDDVVWEVLNLAPNQQVRIDVNSVKMVACDPLSASVTLNAGCLDDASCSGVQADSLNFLIPPFAVRTSNAQTADLPFCDTGEVILTVKNASASAHIYQLVVSQTISFLEYISGSTRMTVTNKSGAVINGLADVPFEPVITTLGGDTLLTWQLTNPGITLSQTEILTDRAAEDLITIHFLVQTDCSLPGLTSVKSQAGGLHSCGTFFTSVENAVTLPKQQPDITLIKQGLNATRGETGFNNSVIGDVGDTIVWRITARNDTGAYFAQNVVVTDTLPPNMNASLPSASATTGVVTPALGVVTWDLGTLPADGLDRTMFITTTIDSEAAACQSTSINTATLTYGCDNGCIAQPLLATATLQSRPTIQAQTLDPGPLNICGGVLTVTLTNNGSPAYNVFLTDTLPSGFVFQEMISASTGPVISPTVGDASPVWAWTGAVTIPMGVTTLTFRVGNSSTTGACANPASGPNNLSVSFDDAPACIASNPYTATNSATINVIAPNLVVDKSPPSQVADAGQVVSWTITVRNTGAGAATFVQVTDTVGSGFNTLVAGSGLDADETSTPTIAGSAITWSPPVTLASGETWTAVVTAMLNASGIGLPSNTVAASGACASGCTYASGSDTAFVTLLTNFDKGPAVQTGTIGSLAVFTFTASLPDVDALYQNLALTDTLPTGLGYVSSILTYTFDGDNGGGTTLITTTPAVLPAQFQSGNVIWQLGDLSGTVLINGVITTVIQDIAANSSGVNRTNSLSMTYTDQGHSYLVTDTAQADIAEPVLHLSKFYITPLGCTAMLLPDNFNDNNDTGWTQAGGGWSVVNGVYGNNSDGTNRRSFNGSLAWTDYSFSAMLRSSDNDEMGLLFRAQSDNTSFYRFQWRQQSGGTIGQRLERVEAGTAIPLAFNTTPYLSGQWYHVEIRAEGSRLRVFVDHQLVFDVSDTTFAAGRIGVYANNQNAAFFDDILVTRLEQQGCFVGANDLVTYTLTISNQGSLPGYDLVITDAIPAGMGLVTYSLQSDDPASAFNVAPIPPVPGTADLVWKVNQLNATTPFNPLAHSALTLTVVLQVADGITANTSLSNQAALFYDSWPGDSSPTPISRTYSGGSHSAAVQTVNGGLAKTVSFNPPPTATLGTLVTYTLIVPAAPISATLYNVVITDQLNLPRFFIESVTSSGGTGETTGFDQATGLITATFASIPHNTQALITVTSRISHEFPGPANDPNSGNSITNSAVMTHSTATALTTTNVVTTSLGEPSLDLDKNSNPPAGSLVQAGSLVTYTITITNLPGPNAGMAYDLVFTDTLPVQMRSVPPVPVVNLNGTPLSSPAHFITSYDGSAGVFVVTFAPSFSLPVGSILAIEYAAVVDSNMLVGTSLTNWGETSWSSLPGNTPGDRNYLPITDTTTLTSGGLVTLTKQLNDADATRAISGTVPYSIVLNLPLGSINNLIVTDTLDAGLIYHNNPLFSGPAGISLPPIQTIATPNDGSGPVIVVWDFGSVTNPPGNPQPIVISFTAAVANVITNVDGTTLDNDINASWTDVSGPRFVTDTHDADDVITVTVPALVVDKRVNIAQVAPGGSVTWTVVVGNVGSGPALGVDLSDTLPSAFFSYQPGSTQLNGSPVADPAIAGLNLFWDLNQTLAAGAAFTLTFQALVNLAIPTGVFTNVASAINGTDDEGNPIPPDSSGRVPPDTDGDDTDDALVLVTLLQVTKSVNPSNLVPNQETTYTIRIDNPGGTAITPTVTDTLPSAFAYAGSATPQAPDIIAPPVLVWNTLPVLNTGQSLTLTFRVTAATQLAGIYTNNVEVAGTDSSGNVVTDTDSTTVTLTASPGIVVTKTRLTPSPVAQGGPVVYSLTVQNLGNTTLFTVSLLDSYNPAQLQFANASLAPDSTAPVGTLTWNDITPALGDLAPGASGTVVVTFTALFVAGGVTAINGVQAAGVDTNTTTVTDTDSTPVTIQSPRLDFDKVVSPTGTISPGQRLDYSICLNNSGTLTATNIVITDFVPFNTTFISGTVIAPGPASVAYQDNGGAFVTTPPLTTTGLRWALAELSPAGNICVGFSVRVNMTISDTASGLSVLASPLGWIVLSGDTSGLEIITRTMLTTPTFISTPTPTETPVPTVPVSSTPEITATPEVAITVTPAPTPSPVISATETPAPLPTETPTLEATATFLPTEMATPTPTSTATPLPTETPTVEPTATQTIVTNPPTAEPTATSIITDAATPEPTPTIEPAPTLAAVLPGWFVAVGLVAVPVLYGQPAFQEPITPTDTATIEPSLTHVPTATSETPPTSPVTPAVVATPTETATTQPAATLSETTITPIATPTTTPAINLTTTPEVIGTPEISLTLTPTLPATDEPTPQVSVTPEITATEAPTDTSSVMPNSYPVVAFDTVMVNIPNVATLSSDQTPTQTDIVTNPLIRVVDPLLTKVVNPSQANPGDLVSFQLTLDNPSPPSNANATNIVLVDPLPYLVDLVSYNISSVPGGLVDSVSIITNIVPIVGHPRGITQTVATTITVSVPILAPNQRVILDLTTRVNNLASPPPQTVRNIAFLTYTEGSVPPVSVAVDVPLPPSRPKGDDNNDDSGDGDNKDSDNNGPLPATATPTLPSAIQPVPALPVNVLPETGIRQVQAANPVDSGAFLLVILGLGITLFFWQARFNRKNK